MHNQIQGAVTKSHYVRATTTKTSKNIQVKNDMGTYYLVTNETFTKRNENLKKLIHKSYYLLKFKNEKFKNEKFKNVTFLFNLSIIIASIIIHGAFV